MRSGIYVIRHTATNRLYVGSALSIKKRCNQHKRDLNANIHDNQRLQRAWSKYGSESFEFSVLEYVDDPSCLLQREQHWIDILTAAIKPNYNICPMAGSSIGRKASPAVRAKMSAAHIGKRQSPEAIEKTASAHRGMRRSLETCAKIAVSQKGHKMHPNTRAAIAVSRIGHIPSAETRAKISAAKRGLPKSPETRMKMSIAKRGNKHTLGCKLSLEHRAMISAHKATAMRDKRGRFI
jgi:group I intron endonuclease